MRGRGGGGQATSIQNALKLCMCQDPASFYFHLCILSSLPGAARWCAKRYKKV